MRFMSYLYVETLVISLYMGTLYLIQQF